MFNYNFNTSKIKNASRDNFDLILDEAIRNTEEKGVKTLSPVELCNVAIDEIVAFTKKLNADIEKTGMVDMYFTQYNAVETNEDEWNYPDDGDIDFDDGKYPVKDIRTLQVAGLCHVDDMLFCNENGKFVPKFVKGTPCALFAHLNETASDPITPEKLKEMNDTKVTRLGGLVSYRMGIDDVADEHHDFIDTLNKYLAEELAK